MPSVEETINTTYSSGRTYTAVKSLFLDARKKNPDVTLEDVRRWIAKNIVRTKNYKFQNSWVPKGPREEYQIDMFEYKYKQPEKRRVRPFKFQRGKNASANEDNSEGHEIDIDSHRKVVKAPSNSTYSLRAQL